MKVFLGVLTIVSFLMGSSLLAAETRVGAEFDVAVKNSSGTNTKDTKGDMTIKQGKVDLFMHYSADKTKAVVQFDLLSSPISSNVEVDATSGMPTGVTSTMKSVFDDAWLQYSVNDKLNVKLGIDWAYRLWIYNSAFESYAGIMDYVHGVPKLELNGAANGIVYGIQMWEDVAPDQSADDEDGALGTNMALKVGYKKDAIDAGLIYRMDKGYGEGAAKVEDKTGYALYANYKAAAYAVNFGHTQQLINKDQKKDTTTQVKVSYLALNPVSLHLLFTMDTPEESAGDYTQNIVDLAAKYKVNDNLTYFGQLINYGETAEGTQAYSDLYLGLEGRF
jgi:hypothetical protein